LLVRAKIAFVLATLLGAAGLSLAAPVNAAAPADPNVRFEQHILALQHMKATFSRHHHSRVCSRPSTQHASCNAVVDDNVSGNVTANVLPAGYGPADLRAAYQLPSGSAGSGQMVAIVDAYDLPTAEADLATYRTKYGLPPCTTANGCFQKVNQNGGSTPPAVDTGWGQEIALDLDMVSAACPNCSILLVEADDSGLSSLGTAENTAVSLGATAVSNSWGGGEFSSESFADSAFFNHPGVAITVSAGDAGYGVQYPAASPNVIAVGGTSLSLSGGTRGFSESVWSGTGSGCSAYEAKPSWQHDSGCNKRSVVDVSADADPATGVAVYDSTASGGLSGWLVFGGTSASAPYVAGAYELTTHASPAPAVPTQTLYANLSSFFDVTTGSNGTCSPAPAYLCTAQAGYDGPTGLGTLDGVSAFAPAPVTPPSTPSAPTLSTLQPGDGKATITWQAPADDGGSAVTGYVVTPSLNGVPQAAHIYNTPALTEVVAGLSNGSAYTFTVSAVSAAGTGTASAASSPVTPFDAVTNKYAALGGAGSFLGAPSGAEVFLAGGGRSQAFAGGSIYWSAATGAHVVQGVLLTKYKALGAASSVLGYPTTDQGTSPDHVGLYNHFAKGAIYWSPAYGAHDVVGALQTKWAAAGWEMGSLGYPTTDSLTSLDHVGMYNLFAKGSIYWQPTLGAHYVLGALQTKYAALGAERGRLRYPIGDSFTITGGWRSNFQHGYLTYATKTKAVAVHYTS
jgi:hypothetical protein